ncbi:glycerol-3-phosphate dehydrogenase [Mycobacterium sp. djl-10]|jgi:glycerol-3-phosphate dehydrogenase|nr:glycerol-3-phosphate dehydrogenase [Mycobacterium sp. djl-10]
MRTVALNQHQRHAALAGMADRTLDMLVIGGGVVGAGTALDAAARGLDVGLVEARDLASGTSSRSSKLIHGGLRYLEMLEFKLVGEALKERGLLLHDLAPHLVRPVPFLYPLQRRGWERLYTGAGVLLYDLLGLAGGRRRRLPVHRHLTRTGALRVAPALRPDSLVGALQYHDAQVDDARFVLTIARTAAVQGATIATRAAVTELLRADGRVVGARVEDRISGQQYTIRAREVVLATGVWSADLLTGGPAPDAVSVRASKGIHLVVPRDRIKSDTGLILRTAVSVLFVIPRGQTWLIGTTDTDWRGDKAHPAASAADIEYLLNTVNSVLTEPITRDDVLGVYAGLRPLVAGDAEHTAKLSREHVVAQPEPGLTVVAGGKYTTYRVMAQDAVDTALGRSGPPSRTETIPLAGAVGYRELAADPSSVCSTWGLSEDQARRLLNRYGSLIAEVLAVGASRRELLEPIDGGAGHLGAEVVYAVTHEAALHLEDVLTRRTRVSVDTADRGLRCAERVAALMAAELGWDAQRRDAEVAHYRRRVQAELASQAAADDTAADAARLSVTDITVGDAP